MTPQIRRWLSLAGDQFPSVRRINRIYANTIAILEAARLEAGAPPLPRSPTDPQRGRRSLLNHADIASCSRERIYGEVLDKTTHRTRHRSVHVPTCPSCQSRRYQYEKRHPQVARPLDWWRASDKFHATVDGKPRRYLDMGWDVALPEPRPGTLAMALHNIENQNPPETLIRFNWPRTDDEDGDGE